jgi:ribosome-associated translation inhibitor RaiA
MELPVLIATRNITLAVSEEEAIRREARKLETFADRITSCRVMVETPHRRGNEGVQYLVRIDLTLPGRELVVKRQPQAQLRTALQDAFDVAKRQVQDYVRRRRGFVTACSMERSTDSRKGRRSDSSRRRATKAHRRAR